MPRTAGGAVGLFLFAKRHTPSSHHPSKKNNLAKIVWTEIHEKAFTTMKKIVACEALLAYPDFEHPFEIHTDMCDIQLGSVISQN